MARFAYRFASRFAYQFVGRLFDQFVDRFFTGLPPGVISHGEIIGNLLDLTAYLLYL